MIECHGTGTPLGDPIEINSLKAVYGGAERTKRLLIGSVKTYVGHTEAAAGIAGVVKACLVMSRGVVPPLVHFEKLNRKITLDPMLRITTELTEDAEVRYSAVSSFGFSGTNAHCVLERVEERKEYSGTVEWNQKSYWLGGVNEMN